MPTSENCFPRGALARTCLALGFLLRVAVAAVAGEVATPRPGGADSPPNIVVICADDLGFGDLGCYGASGLPTPNIDKLAGEGVRFTNFYATAATCTPSRYSLLTGAYPWRNPRARILSGDAPMIIGPRELTLPGALKRAGYATAVVGKWHIGLGDGKIDWNGEIRPAPVDVGFDESFVMAATNDRVPCVYVENRRVAGLDPSDPLEVSYEKQNPFPDVPSGRDHPELLTLRHADKQHHDTIVGGVPRIGFSRGGKAAIWDDATMADVFLARAKDFVTRRKDGRFFLYFALHQPHVPRLPSARFRGVSPQGARGDVILEMDWMVGEFIAHLKSLGLAEKTLVVFTSDNGPVLRDGYQDRADELVGDHRPAGPLRGGKYSLFDGGARVPTILWAPGRARPGESGALLSQVDFLATFSGLAGVKLDDSEKADSLALSDALLGRSARGREHLVVEGFGAQTLLREGDWVYIPSYPGPRLFGDKQIETGHADGPQLYDLSSDIGQRRDLAQARPERVKAMDELLAKIRARRSPAAP